jgi:hypothetical protein
MTTTPGSTQPQTAREAPTGTTISEAIVPTIDPPYENPLDLRCPLHWTWDSLLGSRTVKFEEGSHEWEAQEAASEEMWNNEKNPTLSQRDEWDVSLFRNISTVL